MNPRRLVAALAAASVFLLVGPSAHAQLPLDNAFSFQGELRSSNVVVNTPTDFIFDLYDQSGAGTLLGSNTRSNVAVQRGVFTVELDFGASAFTGDKRWIEIRVRSPAGFGSYKALAPRVELRATPNALFALAVADDSVSSQQIVDGGVGKFDLADNAVSSAKIADGTITKFDLQDNSVSSLKIADGAVGIADIGPDVVSSIDGVANDGGNVDLIAGANVSITPNDAADTITISASSNAGTLDFLDSTAFLRSDVSDTFSGATLTMSTGTALVVGGSLNVVGSIDAADGSDLFVSGNPANFTIGGANLELQLGDTSSDVVRTAGGLEIQGQTLRGNADGPDGDFAIYVYDDGSDTNEKLLWDDSQDQLEWSNDLLTTGVLSAAVPSSSMSTAWHRFGDFTPISIDITGADDVVIAGDVELGGGLHMGGFDIWFDVGGDNNYIQWLPVSDAFGCGGTTGPMFSTFSWKIEDNTSSGWVFKNPGDIEFAVDEAGNLGIDGALNTSGGCDLAETFLGPDDLDPGTVVSADPSLPEAVVVSHAAYDPALVGVVSTRPGLVMNGPTADAEPVFRRMAEVAELAQAYPENDQLREQKDDLERALDSWTRGDVQVALVGRTPVKVTGPITAGEPLTSGHLAGHAMAMSRPGPSLGIALESKPGAGTGLVVALVQPGWRSPVAVEADVARRVVADDDVAAALSAVEQSVAQISTRLDAIDGRAGRDGDDARDGTDGATGSAGDDGRDGDAVAPRTGPAAQTGDEAWADFDGDELVDVAVLDEGGLLSLRRNLGDGTFLDVTGALHHDAAQPLSEIEWTDYDGDRRADLRTVAMDGGIVLHHNLGRGAFEAVEVRSAGPAPTDADAEIAELKARVERLTKLVESLTAARPEANR